MIAALENHLWQSTLLACVVALLTLMLRRNRAAVRHWLTPICFVAQCGYSRIVRLRSVPCGERS